MGWSPELVTDCYNTQTTLGLPLLLGLSLPGFELRAWRVHYAPKPSQPPKPVTDSNFYLLSSEAGEHSRFSEAFWRPLNLPPHAASELSNCLEGKTTSVFEAPRVSTFVLPIQSQETTKSSAALSVPEQQCSIRWTTGFPVPEQHLELEILSGVKQLPAISLLPHHSPLLTSQSPSPHCINTSQVLLNRMILVCIYFIWLFYFSWSH